MKIDKLTPNLLDSARDSWINRANLLDMPSLEYEMVFTWAAKHIDYADPAQTSFAYGLFDDDDSMLAVIDIIYRKKPGVDLGWLKLMDIRFSPDFSPTVVESDPGKYEKVIEVFQFSIPEVVALTATHRARVVKIYGRSQAFMQLLIAIKNFFENDDSKKYSLEIEGRWLVISEK